MENSKILLRYAIGALKQTNIKDGEWAIGGGTVLASYYNHRMSTLFTGQYSKEGISYKNCYKPYIKFLKEQFINELYYFI